MARAKSNTGAYIGLTVILLWFAAMSFALQWELNFKSPLTYFLILILTHLYTGLFITAHDAMHGTVSKNLSVNHAIGHACSLLFSFNFYRKLFPKHHEHHKYVATDKDPDYHGGNFFVWYFSFLKQYVNIWQILLMAITFNVLKLFLDTENLIVFWMIPAVLSTLQLFYFGTYLPHRGEHNKENIHKSRSQKLNHLKAFFTCYFFGYHYEHHASPGTPWWQLWKVKEEYETSKQ